MLDRPLRHVPDLDHRHPGAEQQLGGSLAVRGSGQHDRLRAACQHGPDQPLLLAEAVHRVADQQLVVGPAQHLGEAVRGVGEVGVGERRQNGGDEAGPLRGQAARHPIRDVAQLLDGPQHAIPLLFGDAAGIGQHARDGHRRHARKARDVLHGGLGGTGGQGFGLRSGDAEPLADEVIEPPVEQLGRSPQSRARACVRTGEASASSIAASDG